MTLIHLLDALPPAITTQLINTSAHLVTGPTAISPPGTATTPPAPATPSAAPTTATLTGSPNPASIAPVVTPSGTAPPAAPPTSDTVAGLGDFTWTQLVTLTGSLIAAAGVIITLLFNASKSRRDALATLYADALGAVAEYLEGPYRILRKDGTATTRFAITSKLSDVKTDIDHHQALLRLHARTGVADAYDAYVNAAKAEAGKQMHEAWEATAITDDADVNLNVALPRGDANAARTRLLDVMQADLARRWYKPKSATNYDTAVAAGQPAAAPEPAPAAAQSDTVVNTAATSPTTGQQPPGPATDASTGDAASPATSSGRSTPTNNS